ETAQARVGGWGKGRIKLQLALAPGQCGGDQLAGVRVDCEMPAAVVDGPRRADYRREEYKPGKAATGACCAGDDRFEQICAQTQNPSRVGRSNSCRRGTLRATSRV